MNKTLRFIKTIFSKQKEIKLETVTRIEKIDNGYLIGTYYCKDVEELKKRLIKTINDEFEKYYK